LDALGPSFFPAGPEALRLDCVDRYQRHWKWSAGAVRQIELLRAVPLIRLDHRWIGQFLGVVAFFSYVPGSSLPAKRNPAPCGEGVDFDVRDGLEADAEAIDLKTVITDLLTGQYRSPVRVVAFNTEERWSEDVAEDVAEEIRRPLRSTDARAPSLDL